ncbi:MAG: phosphatidate cytidylyltransferase [Acidobacteriota bacterium]
MIRRVATAAILLPPVLLSIFYFPLSWFLLVIDLFLFLGVFELLRLLAHYGVQRYWLTFPLVLLLPWIWSYHPTLVLAYLVLASLICMGWDVFQPRDVKSGFFSTAGNLMAIIYIGIPLSIAASFQPNQASELLLILSIIWAGDIASFLVGKTWGKHKVTPRVSPNKSLEGYIAGLVFSVLTAILFGRYLLSTWPTSHLLLTGTFLALAGTVGDLFESMLKRGAELKDSSNLMPGHGGILDRIDSLLFAFPAYYLLSILLK